MTKEEGLMILCLFLGILYGWAFTSLYYRNKKVEELKRKYIRGYGDKKISPPQGCGYQPKQTPGSSKAKPPRKK